MSEFNGSIGGNCKCGEPPGHAGLRRRETLKDVELEPGWLARQFANLNKPYTMEEFDKLDYLNGPFPCIGRLTGTVADLRAQLNAMTIRATSAETLMDAFQEGLAATAEDKKRLEDQCDSRCDRAWISGAKFGWGCAEDESPKKFEKAIAAKQADIDAAMKERA